MKQILAAVVVFWWACCMAPAALAVPTQDVGLPAKAVAIAPGDRVEFTIGPDGEPVVTSRGRVSAAESAAVPKVDNSTEAVFERPLHARPTEGRLTAWLLAGPDGLKLIMLNGYNFPVGYRAMLAKERNGERVYKPTSVCPARAGTGAVESWAEPAVGVVLSGFHRADPDNLKCSDGSLLSESASGAGPDRFACVGGVTPGRLSPFTITLLVNSRGAVQREEARWLLSKGDLSQAPSLGFEYGMMGRSPTPIPASLGVIAVVGLAPPPKSKAANIVLLVNGVEKARRPWKMYANAISGPRGDPSRKLQAFLGVVPFVPEGAGDAGLKELLASVGQPGVSVEARIVGDDGAVLGDGTYAVDQPPVRDASAVAAILDQALALARTPTRCQKLDK